MAKNPGRTFSSYPKATVSERGVQHKKIEGFHFNINCHYETPEWNIYEQ